MGSQPLEPLEGELRTHLGQCSPEQGGGLHLRGRASSVGRTGLAGEGALLPVLSSLAPLCRQQ